MTFAVYSFLLVYLPTLSLAKIIQNGIIGKLVDNGSEAMCQEAVVA
jgi:hypothetical protein